MTTELQDKAWRVLPKEFKEVLKKEWQTANNEERLPHDAFLRGCYSTMALLFGHHNLTPDAEGEDEMLTISRKEVQEQYRMYRNMGMIKRLDALMRLFGSKCLPDEKVSDSTPLAEPKPFKYKVGQKVILHFYGGEVSTITEAFNDGGVWNKYKVKMLPTRVWNENELDPYEEPKPAEPKFKHKIGDKVRIVNDISHNNKYNGNITEIVYVDESDPNMPYKVDIYDEKFGGGLWYQESDLELYTETEVSQMKPIESKVSVYLATKKEDEEFRMLLHENGFTWNSGTSLISHSCWSSDLEAEKIHYIHPDKTATYYGDKTSETLTFSEFKKRYFVENVNLSKNIKICDKQFDNILKDSFRGHNRLHIAAMAMQGLLANEGVSCFTDIQDLKHMDFITYYAFEYADKLIKKSEEENDMNYDITFCEGKDCQRKEECHRYHELLRFRADTDPNKNTYISMCKPTDTTKCTLFWREKGDNDGED